MVGGDLPDILGFFRLGASDSGEVDPDSDNRCFRLGPNAQGSDWRE